MPSKKGGKQMNSTAPKEAMTTGMKSSKSMSGKKSGMKRAKKMKGY